MYDPVNVYRDRYKEFIENIRKERPLNERLDYCEDHHIVPRCTFEDKNDPRIDDENNHINLTYREHFIAHKILAEENPDNYKLFYAYWRMCNGKVKIATPDEYEIARVEFSKRISQNMLGEKNHMYGKSMSESTKKKLSESLSGENAPFYGKTFSLSHRRKLSESHTGKILTEETRKKLSESKSGERHPLYNTHRSDETKQKISNSRVDLGLSKGENNPFYSRRHTEESKQKIRDNHPDFRGKNNPNYGRVATEEQRRRMSESKKGLIYHVKCRVCGKEFEAKSGNSKYCENCR